MSMKKLKTVMLAVLIASLFACTEVPVRLELPDKPGYYHDISSGVIANRDVKGTLLDYTVSLNSMTKLAKNKALCRESNKVLRAIILTTH